MLNWTQIGYLFGGISSSLLFALSIDSEKKDYLFKLVIANIVVALGVLWVGQITGYWVLVTFFIFLVLIILEVNFVFEKVKKLVANYLLPKGDPFIQTDLERNRLMFDVLSKKPSATIKDDFRLAYASVGQSIVEAFKLERNDGYFWDVSILKIEENGKFSIIEETNMDAGRKPHVINELSWVPNSPVGVAGNCIQKDRDLIVNNLTSKTDDVKFYKNVYLAYGNRSIPECFCCQRINFGLPEKAHGRYRGVICVTCDKRKKWKLNVAANVMKRAEECVESLLLFEELFNDNSGILIKGKEGNN